MTLILWLFKTYRTRLIQACVCLTMLKNLRILTKMEVIKKILKKVLNSNTNCCYISLICFRIMIISSICYYFP